MSSTQTLTFAVDGMHCGSCGMLIDDTLADLDGVLTSTTSFRTRTAAVEVRLGGVEAAAVIAAIGEAGYTARLREPR
jgi:Cu+-exporting ATPase